jgi:hypothetical protein
MPADEARLTELERSLRYRLASGEFDHWFEATDSVFRTPPWYELGLEIVRLRLRLRGGELADLARQLIRDELCSVESRLCDERQRAGFCGNDIGYQFSKIHEIIDSASPDKAESNFVAFVLNAPADIPANDAEHEQEKDSKAIEEGQPADTSAVEHEQEEPAAPAVETSAADRSSLPVNSVEKTIENLPPAHIPDESVGTVAGASPDSAGVVERRPRRGRPRQTPNLHPEVEPFLDRLSETAKRQITVADFCLVSGFGDDTVFGFWRQGRAERCPEAHARRFERTLKLSPEEFLAKLAEVSQKRR